MKWWRQNAATKRTIPLMVCCVFIWSGATFISQDRLAPTTAVFAQDSDQSQPVSPLDAPQDGDAASQPVSPLESPESANDSSTRQTPLEETEEAENTEEEPTATAEPTATPLPTNTSTPTATVEPTATPTALPTDTPTAIPSATSVSTTITNTALLTETANAVTPALPGPSDAITQTDQVTETEQAAVVAESDSAGGSGEGESTDNVVLLPSVANADTTQPASIVLTDIPNVFFTNASRPLFLTENLVLGLLCIITLSVLWLGLCALSVCVFYIRSRQARYIRDYSTAARHIVVQYRQ